MATYVKTTTELKAITAVPSAEQSLSSEHNVGPSLSAMIFISFGLDSATTPVGTEFRVEVASKATGNDGWRTIATRLTNTVAPSAIATDVEEVAGATVIECGATVPALGDIVFFKNSTLANSEWAKVVKRVTTGGSESFTLLDGLTNTQAAGTYYNKAEQFVIPLFEELNSVKRLRVVCNNNYAASSASCVWRCAISTCDSIG